MEIVGRCPKGELIRAGVFCLIMLTGSGWFFYDGLVKYPNENLREAIENLPAHWPKVSEEHDWPTINPKVTPEGVAFLREGMKIDEVVAQLGTPAITHSKEQRYFGPAGYLEIKLLGQLVKSFKYKPVNKHQVDDIVHQKWIAGILLCIGLYALYRVLRLATLRTVLNDDGLTINHRKPIPWDAMRELDDSEYARKAWVYLRYTQADRPGRIKLDSYRIHTFREMISELCSRKGFAVPFLDRKEETETTTNRSD